ncbi:MAG: hypothetical protein P1P69_01845 [Methanosarcinaceae archaeon]|nr:hypothetical protein [Methanosarcinaceae archaeon]MDF1533230.1 hypothetical protein [Methanosarcinaceae archaeon]
MPIPELCPLDGKSGCKASGCHLYHVDWRSGEINCSIGYRAIQKPLAKTDQVLDTYAQNTSVRLGRDIPITAQIRPLVRNVEGTIRDEPVVSQTFYKSEAIIEKVVISDRNTTVVDSNNVSDGETIINADVVDTDKNKKKKGKSIDDAMKLDLPDNYEEDFWS